VCGPTPSLVVAAPAAVVAPDGGLASCGPLRLATAGGTLYWSDTLTGTINRVATAGGTPVTIADGQAAPTLVRIAGASLFWLASGTQTIMKASLPNGAPTPVVTAPTTDVGIEGFAVTADGLTVYFSSGTLDRRASAPGPISRVAAAGGPVTVIGIDEEGTPGPVAVDGTTVVFSDAAGGFVDAMTLVDGTLAECELPPSNPGVDDRPAYVDCTHLAQGRANLSQDDIFVTGGQAYFVAGNRLEASSTSKYDLHDISFAFGGNTIVAFTLGGASAYFAEVGSVDHDSPGAPALPGFVERTPLVQESNAVPLARVVDPRHETRPATITSIAVSADAVFYATGDCAIWTVAK
jgi:hypothetical protein